MKITIEPETDAEKEDPRIKRMVYAGMGPMAMVAIPAEQPEQTAIYLHTPEPPVVTVALLQQRMVELNHLLLRARFAAENQQAKPAPLIQVAQPNIPFPGVNDRLQGK